MRIPLPGVWPLLALACRSGSTSPKAEVCPTTAAAPTAVTPALHAPFRLLVFTRTMGYRHASIPAGIAAVQVLGAYNSFSVAATEDPAAFTDSTLARFA